eukprot:COSAG01_NODE_3012_length_6723_cov_13.578351_5_plen_552_part_00
MVGYCTDPTTGHPASAMPFGGGATVMTHGAILCLGVAIGYAVAVSVGMAEAPCPPCSSSSSSGGIPEAQGPTVGSRPPTTAESQWLANEGANRAAGYIQAAESLCASSLRARDRELARSGKLAQISHPAFMVQWLVLAALDLSPTSQPVQLDAAKLMLAACDLEAGPLEAGPSSDAVTILDNAVAMAAAACRQHGQGKAKEKSRLQALLKWVDNPQGVLLYEQPAPRAEILSEFGGRVREWLRPGGGPPDLPASFLISNTSKAGARSSSDSVRKKIAARSKDHLLFPTHVTTTNVIDVVPVGFCDRLAKLATDKYTSFTQEEMPSITKRVGESAAMEGLNDYFFIRQAKGTMELRNRENQAWWPEMYKKSSDFKLLRKLFHASMLEYAARHGIVLPAEKWRTDRPDLYDIPLWAAVYPAGSKSGARHGHHIHTASLVSCVLYVQTSQEPSPIGFADPRGVDSSRDWDEEEKDDYDPNTQREPPRSFVCTVLLVESDRFVCLGAQQRRRSIERNISFHRRETSYVSRLGWYTRFRQSKATTRARLEWPLLQT